MRRPGASLLETLFVACLFGFVLWAVAGFAASQSRVLARLNDRTRAEDVVRTAYLVVGADTRSLASVDLAAVAADSIRLRAVRGGGPVCATADGTVFVRYTGVRQPNPDKDSVLIVGETASAGRAFALVDSHTTGRCGGSVALDLAGAQAARGWALVFETGAYHLAGRAVRYRRGLGGRQALTESLLHGGAFTARADGRLQVRLVLHPDSVPRAPPGEAVLPLRPARDAPP